MLETIFWPNLVDPSHDLAQVLSLPWGDMAFAHLVLVLRFREVALVSLVLDALHVPSYRRPMVSVLDFPEVAPKSLVFQASAFEVPTVCVLPPMAYALVAHIPDKGIVVHDAAEKGSDGGGCGDDDGDGPEGSARGVDDDGPEGSARGVDGDGHENSARGVGGDGHENNARGVGDEDTRVVADVPCGDNPPVWDILCGLEVGCHRTARNRPLLAAADPQ